MDIAYSSLAHLAPDVFGLAAVGPDNTVVIRLRGEYDLSTLGALDELLALAEGLDAANVVVDLAEVDFIDATTIGALLRARMLLAGRARTLTLRSPSSWVRRVLGICGATDLVEPARLHASPHARVSPTT